jgi:hypothetical protein
MKSPFRMPANVAKFLQGPPSTRVGALRADALVSSSHEQESISMTNPADPGIADFVPSTVYAGATAGERVLERAKELAGFVKKGLSPQAQRKLLAIRQKAADARGVSEKARGDIEELRDNLSTTRISIQVQNDSGNADKAAIKRHEQDIAVIQNEIARLQSILSTYGGTAARSAELSTALARYVGRFVEGARPHGLAVEPRLLSGETETLAVERMRRRIRELRSDIDRVRAAPYHSTDAKQRARAWVEQLAERGAPNVFELIDRQRGEIIWPEVTTQTMGISRGTGDQVLIPVAVKDTLAVMAWLNPDAMIARLCSSIDADSDDANALTQAERETKVAELRSDILATEREEEALIERLEAAGASLLRRGDADPRAVLGLSSEMPAPR